MTSARISRKRYALSRAPMLRRRYIKKGYIPIVVVSIHMLKIMDNG